jgi:F-type H+-transporting ATPase subunit b
VILASANFGLSFYLELGSLVLVYLFIKRYIVPYLGPRMRARAEAIGSQLEAGEDARRAAAALVAQRRGELEQARADAAVILEQARRSAEIVVAEGTRRAVEDYQRLVNRATTDIASERARVRAIVLVAAAGAITAAVSRVVIAELDGPSQHRLIAEAITATEHETV